MSGGQTPQGRFRMTVLVEILTSRFTNVTSKVSLKKRSKLKEDIQNHETQMNTIQANEHAEIFTATKDILKPEDVRLRQRGLH